MSAPDGGPAFAKVLPNMGAMTLRDYFAGQAMVLLTQHPAARDEMGNQWVAGFCYRIADAMLAERSK